MKILKLTALHIFSILLYFPLVTVLFLGLIFQPSKMIDFYFGLQAITEVFGKKSNKNETKTTHYSSR